MRDSPSMGNTSAHEHVADDPESCCKGDRDRLIDDLAFLVVRHHQYEQRSVRNNEASHLRGTSAPGRGQERDIIK